MNCQRTDAPILAMLLPCCGIMSCLYGVENGLEPEMAKKRKPKWKTAPSLTGREKAETPCRIHFRAIFCPRQAGGCSTLFLIFVPHFRPEAVPPHTGPTRSLPLLSLRPCTDHRNQTATAYRVPLHLLERTVSSTLKYQESPRQTKPKKGPKQKVHECRPFL